MERRFDEIVDVMRVPAAEDPAAAVVDTRAAGTGEEIACEILVVGGGTGGVAAALAAAAAGRRVCLLEETDWLGGQLTAQGVSALDEHEHIEAFGGTARYHRLRAAIRDHYRALAGSRDPAFNPGRCWVTRLAFEPRVALAAIDAMMRPHVESGRLHVMLRTKAFAAMAESDRVRRVSALDLDTRRAMHLRADIVIDATEFGDLLPLTGTEYVVGAETIAETGEPHAQSHEPKPRCVQSFTYTFAAERRPGGERHVIAQPEKYEHYRAAQPYSLTIEVHGGEIYGEKSGWLEYRLYDQMPGTKGGLWTYRRLIDAAQFPGHFVQDVTMMNWPGNDYRDVNILDLPAHAVAAALQDAKRVSLGFFHWLQTEAPAAGARRGAPELRLRPDIMGSTDGLSKHPYVREARRIKALTTIVEQDVASASQPGPRARHFSDSVGVGWYPIDIHRAGPEDVGVSTRTKPFQIPLGALVPRRTANLLAAAKNIGATHITNGCYRLHPVEWNIGEAAGTLAAFALDENVTPRAVAETPALCRRLQQRLLAEGVPLAWLIDVGVEQREDFVAAQRLFMSGRARTAADLLFRPDRPITPAEWAAWGGTGAPPPSRIAAARLIAARLVAVERDPFPVVSERQNIL
jgi:hypothetical protein